MFLFSGPGADEIQPIRCDPWNIDDRRGMDGVGWLDRLNKMAQFSVKDDKGKTQLPRSLGLVPGIKSFLLGSPGSFSGKNSPQPSKASVLGQGKASPAKLSGVHMHQWHLNASSA